MWDCFSRFASLRVGFAARSAKDCKDYPRDCRAPSRRTGWKVISCIAYCWFRFEFTSIRMKDLSVEISIDMRDVPLPLDLAIKQTRRIFQTFLLFFNFLKTFSTQSSPFVTHSVDLFLKTLQKMQILASISAAPSLQLWGPLDFFLKLTSRRGSFKKSHGARSGK